MRWKVWRLCQLIQVPRRKTETLTKIIKSKGFMITGDSSSLNLYLTLSNQKHYETDGIQHNFRDLTTNYTHQRQPHSSASAVPLLLFWNHLKCWFDREQIFQLQRPAMQIKCESYNDTLLADSVWGVWCSVIMSLYLPNQWSPLKSWNMKTCENHKPKNPSSTLMLQSKELIRSINRSQLSTSGSRHQWGLS